MKTSIIALAAVEDRFYAIVSNDKGETLPRTYSPLITVRPLTP